MGNHSMPSKHTLQRTVAAGAIVGCSAVGIGVLSSLAAPMANAKSHSHGTSGPSNSSSAGSGVAVTVSNTDGNTKQSTGAFSGNAFSIPIGIGLTPANAPVSTSIGNISAANGTLDTTAVVVAQTTITTNTTTTTTTTTTTDAPITAG